MLVPLELPRRDVRFADEEKPTLEQFLYGETKNRRVWALHDNTTNNMLRACDEYMKNIEQVIRGIEEVTNQLERNRSRIADTKTGWSVAEEIASNKQYIKRLEQRREMVKALKHQLIK